MNYLLDTDICIYILNERDEKLRSRFLKHVSAQIAVSTLTEAELFYGAVHSARPVQNRERVAAFLEPLTRIPFDSEAAVVFAVIKQELVTRGRVVGAIDMLIAASALAKGYTLITNNEKYFQSVRGLAIENWLRD